MPRYFISYRKTEGLGEKPEWGSFTTESDLALEAHAVRERVERRLQVLGEQLVGGGEVLWLGQGPLDEFFVRREEASPEVTIVYGLIQDR